MVLSSLEQNIKSKIEKAGLPLKQWNVQINYGIKTGLNEAFIINEETRVQLIKKSSKSAEIIRPILRGRDIQKYKATWEGLYIIGTFPSLSINIEEYPAVKDHLLSFGENRLMQSGKNGARKKTNNKWFETQDSISYWEDFFSPKIVWGEISDKSKFAYDEGNLFVEATSFLLTGEKLKYLLALMNSKLLEWCFNQIGTGTGMGTNRWKKYTIGLLPIKVPTKAEEIQIENLVNLLLKNPSGFDQKISEKIDNIIYQMYNLSSEEVKYISEVTI